jgi:hypothetical protein
MARANWSKLLGGLAAASLAAMAGCAATATVQVEAGHEAKGVATSAPTATANDPPSDKGAMTATPLASPALPLTGLVLATPAPTSSAAAPMGSASSTPVATPGKGCKTDAECATGQSCGFTQGCDTPGVCGPPKMCTKDLVPYCGCDGTDFRGSSTCPARAFRHRGKC